MMYETMEKILAWILGAVLGMNLMFIKFGNFGVMDVVSITLNILLMGIIIWTSIVLRNDKEIVMIYRLVEHVFDKADRVGRSDVLDGVLMTRQELVNETNDYGRYSLYPYYYRDGRGRETGILDEEELAEFILQSIRG